MCPITDPTTTRLPASWRRITGSTDRARLAEPSTLVAQDRLEDVAGTSSNLP